MSEKIVQLNEAVIKSELKELVRGSVEETLNELLEAEANKLTQAVRYERDEQRQDYRSGHYNRNLTTTSGDVTLKVPKLKGISFETAIIERYRRRESSVEEALIEMYLAGISVRRVEDITEKSSRYCQSTFSQTSIKFRSVTPCQNFPFVAFSFSAIPFSFSRYSGLQLCSPRPHRNNLRIFANSNASFTSSQEVLDESANNFCSACCKERPVLISASL